MTPAPLPLVLASGSPRRSELLARAGYRFTVRVPDIEEIHDPDMEIRSLTGLNARLKAEAVAASCPDAVIIAADTLVLLENRALAKPATAAEAAAMLGSLSGKQHDVFTAVCLLHPAARKRTEFSVATTVEFKTLSDEEIRRYHSLVNPFDKAGAYAVQEHGELIIARTEGSLSNVIGLPMEELTRRLESDFAIAPGDSIEVSEFEGPKGDR